MLYFNKCIYIEYYLNMLNICIYVFYNNHALDNIKATINPYNPKASANINIKIIPTNILSYYALALTPASPTIPIANPALYKYKYIFSNTNELNPQHKPAAK